jgi:uncharacterized protein
MIGRREAFSFAAALALAPRSAASQESKVTIGTTSREGGGYALYGSAFVDVLKTIDPNLELRVVPTAGATENAALLMKGDIDIGFVSGEVMYEMLTKTASQSERLTVISVMFSAPGMFAVRADSRFHHIRDLLGRPIAWNAKSSGVTVQARYVMQGLGLDLDRDFTAIYQEQYGEAAPMVMSGLAAALWGCGLRWPPFVTLANMPVGARFVAPDADEISKIRAKFPFMAQMTIPARLYPGQYDPVETVGSWSFLLARPGLPASTGFRLAASLHRAERTGVLGRQLDQTTVENTMTVVSRAEDLQPGVAQYYRKMGLLR